MEEIIVIIMSIINDFTDIYSKDYSKQIGIFGGIVEGKDDIAQCINTIITTPKGSVPLRPDFGSDIYNYIDYPEPVARGRIIIEAKAAIEKWEPRVQIDNITTRMIEPHYWEIQYSGFSIFDPKSKISGEVFI